MRAITHPSLQKLAFKLQKNVLKSIVRLPMPIKQKIVGKPIVIDGQTLDVTVQMLLKLFSPPANHIPNINEIRAEYDEQGSWLAQPKNQNIIIDEFELKVSGGDHIRLRRYRNYKIANKQQPALIFYHGGGYVAGSIKSHDLVCQHLAADGKCMVISVDYRLAPEHPFPTPVDDGLAAYRHIVNNAEKFGVDANRLAVGGDSAGGNLAAVVAQQTKNDKHPPKLQILWVPVVDISSESESYELFATGYFLERTKLRWFIKQYVTENTDKTNPMASPIYGDVDGVAPAVILVAGFDPLRDEGIKYANKLKQAGIDTQLKVYKTLPHVFVNIAGEIKDAKVAFADATDALRQL